MRALFPLLLALLLPGCERPAPVLAPPFVSGELVVLTRNSPTTYYEDAEGNFTGPEHDLVNLFAREVGLRVKFVVVPHQREVLADLKAGGAHMAAAGLLADAGRGDGLVYGPPYQSVQQQVVFNPEKHRIATPADLVGKRIEVPSGSAAVRVLDVARKTQAGLRWVELPQMDIEELLERVADGVVDATVADAHLVALARHYRPELETGPALGQPQPLAWAFPPDADPQLREKAARFFARIEQDGTLRRLQARYYSQATRLQRADVLGFLQKMNRVLPAYRAHFVQAQELTGIDWRLLAAVGYQESHWDPLATSPTGVRGLMMLTADTADRLGVTDRLDPKQSILGGARYLAKVRELLPARLGEPERTWQMLVAYNIGFGHLEDARALARAQKLNPDAWADLKRVLPLLARPAHHDGLKHGYARGGEAVIFTENTRTYYDILVRYQPAARLPVSGLGPVLK